MLSDAFVAAGIGRLCPPDGTYALALYTVALDATVAQYSTENEWKGHGYQAGGAILTGYRIDNGALYFDRAEWLDADISTRSGLIYNVSTMEAIKVLDFKRTVGVQGGMFEVKLHETPVFSFGADHESL